MDSILITIKKLLNVDSEYHEFDTDIITAINTVFFELGQLGVGPKGFTIVDSTKKWSDYVTNIKDLEAIKSYIGLKTRLIFDPPTSSVITEAINNNLKEIEWRLYVEVGNY